MKNFCLLAARKSLAFTLIYLMGAYPAVAAVCSLDANYNIDASTCAGADAFLKMATAYGAAAGCNGGAVAGCTIAYPAGVTTGSVVSFAGTYCPAVKGAGENTTVFNISANLGIAAVPDGMYFNCLNSGNAGVYDLTINGPCVPWSAGLVVTLNECVQAVANNDGTGNVYYVTTAGTTNTTVGEPAWNQTNGGSTNDGGASLVVYKTTNTAGPSAAISVQNTQRGFTISHVSANGYPLSVEHGGSSWGWGVHGSYLQTVDYPAGALFIGETDVWDDATWITGNVNGLTLTTNCFHVRSTSPTPRLIGVSLDGCQGYFGGGNNSLIGVHLDFTGSIPPMVIEHGAVVNFIASDMLKEDRQQLAAMVTNNAGVFSPVSSSFFSHTEDYATTGPGNVYSLGDVVNPATNNTGHYAYVVTTAGTAGGAYPNPWCQTASCTTTSTTGGVVFTRIDPGTTGQLCKNVSGFVGGSTTTIVALSSVGQLGESDTPGAQGCANFYTNSGSGLVRSTHNVMGIEKP